MQVMEISYPDDPESSYVLSPWMPLAKYQYVYINNHAVMSVAKLHDEFFDVYLDRVDDFRYGVVEEVPEEAKPKKKVRRNCDHKCMR
jgi:hypothetical protein